MDEKEVSSKWHTVDWNTEKISMAVRERPRSKFEECVSTGIMSLQ